MLPHLDDIKNIAKKRSIIFDIIRQLHNIKKKIGWLSQTRVLLIKPQEMDKKER